MARSFEIEIRVEGIKKRLSKISLERCIRKILKALGWKKAGLSVLFVSNRKIRSLNKRFLKHDYATDVIAFSNLEGGALKTKDPIPFLGDIVVSAEMAADRAKEFDNRFEYELFFYVCHGILHLMGYEDKTKKQKEKMFRKQEALLKKIGIK